MIPVTATSSVLRKPTSNARLKVESDEYGIRLWLMSKPARPLRNAKPEAMLARCMFSIVLPTIHQMKATRPMKTTIW